MRALKRVLPASLILVLAMASPAWAPKVFRTLPVATGDCVHGGDAGEFLGTMDFQSFDSTNDALNANVALSGKCIVDEETEEAFQGSGEVSVKVVNASCHAVTWEVDGTVGDQSDDSVSFTDALVEMTGSGSTRRMTCAIAKRGPRLSTEELVEVLNRFLKA